MRDPQMRQLTDGHLFNRRVLLKAGGASALSLCFSSVSSHIARGSPPTSGNQRLKPVVIMWLEGGASQKETWNPDPPSAPEELRGALGSVATSVSGVSFSAGWPELARRVGQLSVLRAIDSESNDHFLSSDRLLMPDGRQTLGAFWGERSAQQGVPYTFIKVPGTFSPDRAHDVTKSLQIQWKAESGSGLEAELKGAGRYLPPPLEPNPQLVARRELLSGLRKASPPVPSPSAERMDRCQDLAFSLLLGDGGFATAFNPAPAEQRDHARDVERYGKESRVGQALLLARRLLCSGAGVITVHNGCNGGWDQHSALFERIKPMAAETDRACAAFLDDMAAGRADCVFVIMGEFGRTPKVNSSAGRDHWGESNCGLFAGGAFARGVVHGRTDSFGKVRDGRVLAKQVVRDTIIRAAGGSSLFLPSDPYVREILT